MKEEINFTEMLFNRDERLLDLITNLQEENERLHIQLEDRAYEQIKFLYKDYKSRIDKAIEKLKYYKAKPYSEYDSDDVIVDLDWILQGEDTKESEVN